jgi:hypothetical protein
MLHRKPDRSVGVTRRMSLVRTQFCAWLRDGRADEFSSGDIMFRSRNARMIASLGMVSALTLSLGACGSFNLSSPTTPTVAPDAPAPEMPSSIHADELVGRWGLASYLDPKDRARTEAAAKAQCKNPYVIGAGTHGGVIMHLADQATPQELDLKGSPGGKNYIGPAGPAGGEQDREVLSFDGRVMITRFIDKDAATRYGTMVYVRCGPKA